MLETPSSDDVVLVVSKRSIARKKWYVSDMARSKSRIKPETRARMEKELEDAIIDWADEIKERRNGN